MDVALSWDLFAIVVFGIVVAYSLIIGTNKTIKVIIAAYLGILAADALGNLFQVYLLSSNAFMQFLKFFGIVSEMEAMIIAKILIFVVVVVLLTVKGGFQVDISRQHGLPIKIITNFVFGILCAGLIISTAVLYISGGSIVQASGGLLHGNVGKLYSDSILIQNMLLYYNFWFSLPVIALVGWSLMGGQENTENSVNS